MTLTYQVQELTLMGWRWFSDFRSINEARQMLPVYKQFYPKKIFRVKQIVD